MSNNSSDIQVTNEDIFLKAVFRHIKGNMKIAFLTLTVSNFPRPSCLKVTVGTSFLYSGVFQAYFFTRITIITKIIILGESRGTRCKISVSFFPHRSLPPKNVCGVCVCVVADIISRRVTRLKSGCWALSYYHVNIHTVYK
uniref:Uncharacterized protein n=1 Tax=Cacopsylla melanoneura TaxID=428564 RepID=A0A8D8TMA5_9HEMI